MHSRMPNRAGEVGRCRKFPCNFESLGIIALSRGRNDSCLASPSDIPANDEQVETVAMTKLEIRGLERIQHQGRIAKYCALGFLAVSMLGGIPVHDKPVMLALPAAMLTCLVLCGVCWTLMVAAVGRRMRSRCPRCRTLFFGIRKLRYLPVGLRALWGNHCVSCGLSLRELRAAKVRESAAAMLYAGSASATAQAMPMITPLVNHDPPMREYVALKRQLPQGENLPAQPLARTAP